ncbi:MAG TPA: 50S ribosomal protein L10 [Dehalococcoidia bacterium]|nr:50S ribosomal protein L10 [Dehalococcoidia bacterium]
MKAGGVDFTIVKNTLLSLAADEAQKPQLKEIVDGPTAIALGYDDPVEAAKAMADFIRTGGTTLAIIGAVMGDDAPMSSSEFTRLAALPPKPILLAMLLGQLQSPIARMVTVMNGPLQSMGNVLAARVRQLEEEGPAPEPEPASEPEAAEEAPANEAPAEETPETEATEEAPADEEPAAEAEEASEAETEPEPEPEVADEAPAKEPETQDTSEEAAE